MIDDDNYEGSEMFELSIYSTGPDFQLPITDNISIITINDPDGKEDFTLHYYFYFYF